MAIVKGKYEEDMERAHVLGRLIDARIKEKFESLHELALLYAERTGLSEITSHQYLGEYRRGEAITQDISSGNKRKKQYEKKLERFTILYELLGLDEDNEIVKITREINPAFIYPRQTIKDNIACRVDVTFEDERLRLNQRQIGHLESLARYYARRNQRRLNTL